MLFEPGLNFFAANLHIFQLLLISRFNYLNHLIDVFLDFLGIHGKEIIERVKFVRLLRHASSLIVSILINIGQINLLLCS